MTRQVIEVCIDRLLPPMLQQAAAARAIMENPANAPREMDLVIGSAQLPPYLALLADKKWRNGRTLRVRFIGGEQAIRERVERLAYTWSEHANITFVFGDDPDAEIRIAFRQGGSWSYIGTDALMVTANRPTMNFGWLREGTSEHEYARVVLHEFGHALGCIHEHQHPLAGIPWNKEAVYRYYMAPPNKWSQDEVDFNLFQRYGQDITQFSAFDARSIMLYAIPSALTLGGYEVGWNTELSDIDKTFIAASYPRSQSAD